MSYFIKISIFSILSILLSLGLFVYGLLFCSLPTTSGTIKLSGTQHPITIERDKMGVVHILGVTREDVAIATGFTHAQERFFQMDLLRRLAAGELSEICGAATVELDKASRLHRFRALARSILKELSSSELAIIKAYTAGVNQGLAQLKVRPFEYLLLRVQPKTWAYEDTLLVMLYFHMCLQEAALDTALSKEAMQAVLPIPVYNFLLKNASKWDASLDNYKKKDLPIPGPAYFHYITSPEDHTSCPKTDCTRAGKALLPKGSNQWAVQGQHTAHNQAILACDMHLPLSVPNTWYRLSLCYTDQTGKKVQVHGVTLPGTPLMVIGSNQHIAWGFTNPYLDTVKPVFLEGNPAASAPTNDSPCVEYIEEIKIKGKPSVQYKVQYTPSGPIAPTPFLNKRYAIQWIAHDKNSCNLRSIALEQACTTQQAIAIAAEAQTPALNFMVADQAGSIGWTLLGHVPESVRKLRQEGKLQVIDPPAGFLWTANNEVVSLLKHAGTYPNPIRAYQIKKRLADSPIRSLEHACTMQLDNESLFLRRWKKLLIAELDLSKEKHKILHKIITDWDGQCSATSHAYFWVKSFREYATTLLLQRILAPVKRCYPNFNPQLPSLDFEEAVFKILEQQPDYLVDPHIGNWKAEMTCIIDQLISMNSSILEKNTCWGQLNRAHIRHILSKNLPFLSALLDMPAIPLSGGKHVPHVMASDFGASERMVIELGSKGLGVISLPCGQSGHPLSRHYRDHYKYWVKGKYLPLLPGKPVKRLQVLPHTVRVKYQKRK